LGVIEYHTKDHRRRQMDGSGTLSFHIPIKQKEAKPELAKVVSSLFAPPPKEPTLPRDPIKPPPKPTRKRPNKAGNPEPEPPRESPFLKLLRQRQQGISPPPLVPAESAFDPDVPLSGFGQLCLREQGLQPGQTLGTDPAPQPPS
jgi:hypothetical protein